MQNFRFSCCERVESPNTPDYHGQLVVIEGLITPYTAAETKTEAMVKLHDWFIEHKCRPYQEAD